MADRPRIGELLVAAGVIDAAALDAALAKQRAAGGRIGKLLLEAGVLSEETLVRTLARQLSMPVAWLRDKVVKPEVLARLPGHVALKHRCMPVLVDQRGTETLLVAMEDPSDAAAIDEIAAAASCPVRVVLAAPTELDDALARHYEGEDEPELLLDDPLAAPVEKPEERSEPEPERKPEPKPAAADEADPFDLGAPGDESLDLGSDLDLAPTPAGGGGVDLEDDHALDLEADADLGERAADSLDAAIDDVRGSAASASSGSDALDLEADTGSDLEVDSDLEVGPDLEPGADFDTDAGLDVGPDADVGESESHGPTPVAVAGAPGPQSSAHGSMLPRDPELRAVVLLLVERGLLSRDELAQCLRAARESAGSES